ncbi:MULTISPECIES: hypothetical protein [unclassified Microcoleus]|uniref:hypothetical protein n=1 Tax=unclassified Microcoleus TaxID=2642155 RepID=UPI002FD41170
MSNRTAWRYIRRINGNIVARDTFIADGKPNGRPTERFIKYPNRKQGKPCDRAIGKKF